MFNSRKFRSTKIIIKEPIRERDKDLMAQMASALELCLACKGPLTWEAEQAADVVLNRYRRAGR